jgi:hypothetical protein
VDDLLGGLDDLSMAPAPQAPHTDEIVGLGAASVPVAPIGASTLPLLLDASAAYGCMVRGKLIKDGMGQHKYCFSLQNCSHAGMSGFHVQFNKNALGVGLPVGDTSVGIGPLAPGESAEAQKDVSIILDKVDQSQGPLLQIALKWTELASSAPFVMVQDKIPNDLMSAPTSTPSNDDVFGGLL